MLLLFYCKLSTNLLLATYKHEFEKANSRNLCRNRYIELRREESCKSLQKEVSRTIRDKTNNKERKQKKNYSRQLNQLNAADLLADKKTRIDKIKQVQ